MTLIECTYEPRGEGNGWDICARDVATSFLVIDDSGDPVAAFDTLGAALAQFPSAQVVET